MRNVFLVCAILFANSFFTSCTDLDDNLENELVKVEKFATGGEDEYLPDDDDIGE